MADRSKNFRPRRVEEAVEELQVRDTINVMKRVQSLIDAHVIYVGQVSGRQYEWQGAGAIVEVDEQDVPELLSKKRGKKPCCGSERQKLFQLA